MKTEINKSAKRALSLVLAFAMLVGCLFTANVGVNIKADALDISDLTISYWDGTMERSAAFSNYTYDSTTGTLTGGANTVLDPAFLNETNATGTSADDPIIIDDAKELATLVRWGTYENTAGLYFKLSDKLDAIVLQPSSVVDAAELMGLSSGAETQAYFEDETRKSKLIDWGQCCNNGTFAGNFNGNGVEIYGLYINPTGSGTAYARENVGLFGCIDPGVFGATRTTTADGLKTYNDKGNTFENVIIKNSYYYGSRRMGAIVANSNSSNYGCSTKGIIYIENCIVTNCYMYCTGDHDGKKTNGAANNGVVAGYPDGEDTMFVKNCLVYGNETFNAKDEKPFAIMGNINTYTAKDGTKKDGKITDCIAIGTEAVIYNKSTSSDYTENNHTFYDIETLRGAAAMAWAEGLEWGKGWYAVEGELPTPIKPESYLTLESKPDNLFAGGNGTKDKPYIIRSVDQLSKMIDDGGMTGGKESYYKVADDVNELYINNATTYEEVTELVASGGYNNWTHGETKFKGVFDGNGVTIYGMISIAGYNGFVPVLDYSDALEPTIKNIIFAGAYVKGSTAGTVTNHLGDYNGSDGSKHMNYISNIAVVESHIESTETEIGPYLNKENQTTHKATAGGILLIDGTPEHVVVSNCLFDGVSSTLIDTVGTKGGANPASAKAGIVGMSGVENEFTINNCVAINEYVVPMMTDVANATVPAPVASRDGYYRYATKASGSGTFVTNSYGMVNGAIDEDKLAILEILAEVKELEVKGKYSQSDIPVLDWAYTWQLVDVKFDEEGNATRTIPMPVGLAGDEATVNYTDVVPSKIKQVRANTYKGSGTQSDPFLITNDTELVKAIACGGMHLNQPLYFKLVNDIDLSGNTWFGKASVSAAGKSYTEFGGILDGDGHIIIGLSAVDNEVAGLVPVLNGGTVKNLHFRDCYAGSNGVAGIIAGQVNSGTIIGCSVEGSVTVGTSKHIIGSGNGNITDSYHIVDGKQTFSSDITDSNSLTLYPADNAEWYKGPDGVIRHLAAAKAHTVTDINGDGIFGDKYDDPTDLVALRNYLLDVSDYRNIYGDVNNNGATNISDLAVLRREMVGTYNSFMDGFWRNAELGMVKIYYAENDTQDMARKLELYLEAALEKDGKPVDIVKLALEGAVTDTSLSEKDYYTEIPDTNAIIITQGDADSEVSFKLDSENQYVASGNYGKYSVTYDPTNHILKINGGSFTAVEEAVNELVKTDAFKNQTDFITGSEEDTVLEGDISDNTAYKSGVNDIVNGTRTGVTEQYKQARWVDKDSDGAVDDGEVYYYAWGDEFESETKTTYSSSNWLLNEYRSEDETVVEDATAEGGYKATSTETGTYLNLESPNFASLPDLWVVENGRLTINRGYRGEFNGYADVSDTIADNTFNDFGSHIEEEDVYIDPGDITTLTTMLFKYGYAEMRASLPSDGHAFPAWWFLTGPARNTNSGIDSTLYSKVYTLNNAENNTHGSSWDDITDKMNGSKLSTYKYQIPAAHLEFDIVELMQTDSSKTRTDGLYIDYFQPTVHKIYTENVYNNETDVKYDDLLYIPDWTNGTYTTWCTYDTDGDVAEGDEGNSLHTSGAKFFVSANGKPYLNNYNHANYNSAYNYYYYASRKDQVKEGTFSMSNVIGKINSSSATSSSTTNVDTDYWKMLRNTYTYGFTWDADPDAGTYTLAIYCDINNDGIMKADTERIFKIDQTAGYADTFKTYKDYYISKDYGDPADPTWNKAAGSDNHDADMWNQYAYALLDNAFYTSNSQPKMFIDLEIAGDEKGTFDIEYVRVYQEDGKRDIVTPETENFNNGNHFGY